MNAAEVMILEGQDDDEVRKKFREVFIAESFEDVKAIFEEIEEMTTKSVPEEFNGDLDAFMNSPVGKEAIANIGKEPQNVQ